MVTMFVISSTLLVILLGLRYFEFVYTEQRTFEMARTRLDRNTRKVFAKSKQAAQRSVEYLHKDIFLNGLHMVTYVALLLVRVIEKRLHRVTLFLRSFKKNKKSTASGNTFGAIRRERSVDEKDEHNT